LKEEEQYLMTRFTVAGFALQGCLNSIHGVDELMCSNCSLQQMSYFPFYPLVKAA
jgi:hypothetical protein